MNHEREAHAQWRKSSYSSDTANCVEVALSVAHVGVRDSKDPDGPVLTYATQSWRDFVIAVRAGDFDLRADHP
jgi:hypothetical protein